MAFKYLNYSAVDNVATISFNRPEVKNAQNRGMILETHDAFCLADKDPAIELIVLRGNGDVFCAGDDLEEDFSDVTNTIGAMSVLENLQRVTRAIMQTPKPVIAVIQGYALGAGCEWAMNCDLRLVAEGTKFGFPETKWGFTVTNAGTKLLPAIIGLGRAKEMVLCNRFIDADTALEWGLATEVVAQDSLDETLAVVIQKLSNNSTLALGLSKQALNQGLTQSYENVLVSELRDAAICAAAGEYEQRIKGGFKKS